MIRFPSQWYLIINLFPISKNRDNDYRLFGVIEYLSFERNSDFNGAPWHIFLFE